MSTESNTPVFSTVSPTNLGLAGGKVTITGTNLSNINLLKIAGQGSGAVTKKNRGTLISAVFGGFPKGSVGKQNISADNTGVPVDTGLKIEIKAPSATSLSPTSGPLAGGTPFTIEGENFGAGASVVFGTTAATDVVVKHAGTMITGTTPAFPGGDNGLALDVAVNNFGLTTSPPQQFTVTSTSLTSISPSHGLISGGMDFTITGEGLSGTSEVLFGTIPATGMQVMSDTKITGKVPQGLATGTTHVEAMVQSVPSNKINFTYDLKTHIPLSIDLSNADLPEDTDVYMYVVGEVILPDSSKVYYRLLADGTPKLMDKGDNSESANTFPGSSTLSTAAANALKENYKSCWADYSIMVTNGSSIDLAKINAQNIPGLGTGANAFSGRIYLSVGVPRIPITVTDTGYAAPTFYDGSGSYCLFDWIEFSFDSNQNLNANTTMVDQFGLSLTLSATPTAPHFQDVTKVGLKDGFSRNDMIKAEAPLFQQGQVNAPAATTTPEPGKAMAYPSNILVDTDSVLRVCSPSTISSQSGIKASVDTYFDTTIEQWYSTWEQTPLVTHDVATGYYSAMATADGKLQFKQGNLATKDAWTGGPAVAFSFATKITSDDIWHCSGVLATKEAGYKTASLNAGKIIAAAFNRGIVSNSLTDIGHDASGFYPPGGIFNEWSQLAHQHGQHGLAYGFAYDDVCNQNPTVALSVPESIKISLEAF